MQLNGNNYVDRHNRPTNLQRVGLRVHFIDDGLYTDPVDISAVTIFSRANNLSPSTVLGEDGLIDVEQVSGLILMNFESSSKAFTGGALPVSAYAPGTNASGIYREGVGKYIVILDGSVELSGFVSLGGWNREIANTCSAVNDYIDVWTVKQVATSDYKTIVNRFDLYDDTFITITEPLLIRSKNTLRTRKINLGEKRDIKVQTDFTVENEKISDDVKNLFKDSVITSAMFQIKKINEEPNLGSRVVVSSFSDTSSLVEITAGNTLVFNWDTNDLKTHAETLAGNMGSLTGIYEIMVKFTMLNETIQSPFMHLQVV